MPTLLITGGAGFIGEHTAKMAMAKGWSVRVFDNLTTNLASNSSRLEKLGAQVLIGDIRDTGALDAAVKKCDAVIHLAAQVSVPRSMEHPEETFDINVRGTENLLQACHAHGVSRFVMASSAAVYGTCDSFPLDEAHAGAVHSPYAESKWKNEHQVQEAKQAGMEAVALRLFNVYGTGQQSEGTYAAVIPKFVEMAVAGKTPTVFGDGLQTRDFVHVDDVAEAFLTLATEPWRQDLEHVYNVCTQTEVSLLDLLEMIRGVLENVAPDVVQPSPNHAKERPGDIARSVGSNARLVRDTHWAPKVEFSEGLRLQIIDTIRNA